MGARLSSSTAQHLPCFLGKRPRTDDRYLEEMARAIFRSGFSWQIIESKWPAFREAFAEFSVNKVAKFDGPRIAALVNDRRIVRNRRKLAAVVENARRMTELRRAHGTFSRYLRTLRSGREDEMLKTVSKRFTHLGKATALFFLVAVGEELPDATRTWMESHGYAGAAPAVPAE